MKNENHNNSGFFFSRLKMAELMCCTFMGSLVYGCLIINIPIGLCVSVFQYIRSQFADGDEGVRLRKSAKRWAISMIPVVGPPYALTSYYDNN